MINPALTKNKGDSFQTCLERKAIEREIYALKTLEVLVFN
jgi:hypothetical protein